jgi:alpha-L-rhamnosidase
MTLPPPFGLKCEHLGDPLGIDVEAPRLSWLVESPRRGDGEEAYRVLVSSSLELLGRDIGDAWDSGKVGRTPDPFVDYRGEGLVSCSRYFWKVRWWNSRGLESPWSEPGSFVTGFLHPGEWKPKWIAGSAIPEFRSRGNVLLGEAGGDSVQSFAVYLRKEFALKGEPALALAFVSGLGQCEFRINGKKVGDKVLDPGWTDYEKKALYSTYDVTSLVSKRNAVGVILGNGRHIRDYGYGAPRLACRIEVEYVSGDRDIVSSDESWKTSEGPLRENGTYFGERYDARLEMDGWDEPGFGDGRWTKADLVKGYPLSSQLLPPIRVTDRLKPVRIQKVGPERFVFDFGQNFTGWVRLKAEGPRGTEIRLRHSELVHEDGSLNTANLENAEATDVYVLRGGAPETYEPRFTYHGFRYVEVSGFPGDPGPGCLEGCFVHSDVEKTGSFASSNELLNGIHRNVIWGQLSNLMSIPTDCPQRDERHGWLGDAHLSAEEALFNFDMAGFYEKFLDDIRLSQLEDGSLPDVVPPYLKRLYPADPAWSSAYATILWYLYLHLGNTRIIARHFQSLKRYLDFLSRNASGFLIKTLGKYGDWCPPGAMVPKKTSVEFTSTWYFYHDTVLFSRMAEAIGRTAEAKEYASLAAKILGAFNGAFLEENQYAAIRVSRVDTYPHQTNNAMPLYLGMVPEDKREKVLAGLLESVVRRQDCHLDTGILGTRYLLDVLAENGHAETAYRIATRTSYPGWGYMLGEGATTLWERWEKLEGPGMNSHNHIMLGSVDAWFYRVLAGLNPLSPGWREIGIKPHPLGDLTSVEAGVKTVRGRAAVSWGRDDAAFRLGFTVPAGSSARVEVPLLWTRARIRSEEKLLWDGSGPGEKHPDIGFVGIEDGRPVFRAESGTYLLEVRRA